MKEILTITSDDDIIIVNVKNNLMFTIIKDLRQHRTEIVVQMRSQIFRQIV